MAAAKSQPVCPYITSKDRGQPCFTEGISLKLQSFPYVSTIAFFYRRPRA